MKRRLTLARALVNDPELLILDEPTTGLDPQARHLIWDGLRQLLGAGQDDPADDAFHGRGRAACDAARGHRPRHADRHRRAARAARASTSSRKWSKSSATKCARGPTCTAASWRSALEVAGETAFCYAADPQPLLTDLATRAGVRYLHRPANLEDLFIKLTGRELRD